MIGERNIVTGEERSQANTKWIIEVMAGAIIGLKENGEPVYQDYLYFHHTNLGQRIRNYPGGWRKVVTEAGFDPLLEAGKGGLRRRIV